MMAALAYQACEARKESANRVDATTVSGSASPLITISRYESSFAMSVTSVCQQAAVAFVLTALLIPSARGALVIGSLGTPVAQNFNGITSGTTLAPLNSGGWRWTAFVVPEYSTGTTTDLRVQSGTMSGSTTAGTYNFRDQAATTDRGVGFLINGLQRNLMLELQNSTGSVLESVTATWDLEKYRNGMSGLNISFFHSSDGSNWTAAVDGNAQYEADADFQGLSSPTTIAKSATISGLSIANGAMYYLRWEFARTNTDNSSSAVGIDNFTVTAGGPVAVPEISAFFAVGIAGAGAALRAVRRRRRRRSRGGLVA